MEKLQKKKGLFLVAAAVFLAVWAVLGFSSRGSGPELVAVQYEKAFANLDTKRLVKCYPPELQKEKKEELKAWELAGVEEIVSKYRKGKVIAGDVVYGDKKETAELSCAVIVKDGNGAWDDLSLERLDLIKIGNKWYIDE